MVEDCFGNLAMTLTIFFKNHWAAIVGALVVGAMFVAPQFIFRANLGADFKGAYLGGTDSEQYYPRIQEVYEGKFKLTHPSMFEGKDLPYSNTPLGEIAAAGLGMTFGLNSREAVVLGTFVFPALLFLLFYSILYIVTSKRLLSFTAATGVLLASNFILYPVNVLDLFSNWSNIRVLLYNRPIHPQASSLFFFMWLVVFWSFVKHRMSRLLTIGSGILFGLLFYVYPFSWMLAAASQGLLGLYSIWKKDWQLMKRLIVIGAIAFVVSIPFWMNFFELIQHPWYDDLVKSQAFTNTRKPLFSIFLGIDVVCLLILLYWVKVKQDVLLFLSLFTLSLILLVNQQVVSNMSFFPGHWHWYYVTVFTVFVTVSTFWFVFERFPRLRTWLCVVLLGVFACNGVVAQKNYYRDASPSAIVAQRYVPVYDWLNKNAEPESVVLAEEQFSSWIPFYTKSNKYFFTFLDTLSLVPAERLRQNLMVSLYLRGVREHNADEYINQKTSEFHFVLFGFWRYKQYGCHECYPEEEIQAFKQEYLIFLKGNIRDEIKKYRADYLVLDAMGDWNVAGLDFLEKQTQIGDFTIYSIH